MVLSALGGALAICTFCDRLLAFCAKQTFQHHHVRRFVFPFEPRLLVRVRCNSYMLR